MSEAPAPKPARRSNLAEIQCPPEVDALALLLGETREEFVAAATSQRVEDIRGKLRAVLPAPARRTFQPHINPAVTRIREEFEAAERRGALGAPAHFDPRESTKTLEETGDRAPGSMPPAELLQPRGNEE